MSMKSENYRKGLHKIDSLLKSAINFNSDEEKLNFEAEMLHLDTMKMIEDLMKQRGMNKKDLARELNISQSFITQLFTADKLINYKLLAKMQRIFQNKFNFEATPWLSDSFWENSVVSNTDCKVIHLSDYHKNNDENEYPLSATEKRAIVS